MNVAKQNSLLEGLAAIFSTGIDNDIEANNPGLYEKLVYMANRHFLADSDLELTSKEIRLLQPYISRALPLARGSKRQEQLYRIVISGVWKRQMVCTCDSDACLGKKKRLCKVNAENRRRRGAVQKLRLGQELTSDERTIFALAGINYSGLDEFITFVRQYPSLFFRPGTNKPLAADWPVYPN